MESNHEVYTVPELAAILKIGRNAAYDLVKSGKIHSRQSVLYLPYTRKMLR